MSTAKPAVPFFARFLEPEELDQVAGAAANPAVQTEFPQAPTPPKITKRFPTDTDDCEPLPTA